MDMSLQQNLMIKLKEAMKSKDRVALESLRAIKSEILLAQTKSGASESLSEEEEITLLQKLVKQRMDSAALYKEQGRDDLADPELAQAKILGQFLPQQMSEEELEKAIKEIVTSTKKSPAEQRRD